MTPAMAQALGTAARILNLPAYKTCSCCGVGMSRPEWKALPLVGIQDCEDGLFLEYRNCVCKSTLAQELNIKVDADWLEMTGILQEMTAARRETK